MMPAFLWARASVEEHANMFERFLRADPETTITAIAKAALGGRAPVG